MKQTLTNEIGKSNENLTADSKANDSFDSFKTNNIVEFIDPTYKKKLETESNQKLVSKGNIFTFILI